MRRLKELWWNKLDGVAEVVAAMLSSAKADAQGGCVSFKASRVFNKTFGRDPHPYERPIIIYVLKILSEHGYLEYEKSNKNL